MVCDHPLLAPTHDLVDLLSSFPSLSTIPRTDSTNIFSHANSVKAIPTHTNTHKFWRSLFPLKTYLSMFMYNFCSKVGKLLTCQPDNHSQYERTLVFLCFHGNLSLNRFSHPFPSTPYRTVTWFVIMADSRPTPYHKGAWWTLGTTSQQMVDNWRPGRERQELNYLNAPSCACHCVYRGGRHVRTLLH